MSGTQRMILRLKKEKPECRVEEPVWVMRKPIPSPIITSFEPVYGVWRDRLWRSAVMW
jgi:hypothetical protein